MGGSRLVLDQLMPGATGTGSRRASAAREHRDVPILVVTGMVSTPLVERLHRLGVRSVPARPITTQELLQAATEALGEPAATEANVP